MKNYSFFMAMLSVILVGTVVGFVVVLMLYFGVIGEKKQQDVSIETNQGFVLEGNTLEELAECIVDYYIDSEMTQYEKYKILHDYIIDTSYYDYEGLNSNNSEVHDARLVLAFGRGVCDGYAYAYQALCEEANLYCDVISGRTAGADTGHAWNIVQIGDEYYHVDVTWDDPVTPDNEPIKVYDYFLVSDNKLRNEGRSFPTMKCTDTSYDMYEH